MYNIQFTPCSLFFHFSLSFSPYTLNLYYLSPALPVLRAQVTRCSPARCRLLSFSLPPSPILSSISSQHLQYLCNIKQHATNIQRFITNYIISYVVSSLHSFLFNSSSFRLNLLSLGPSLTSSSIVYSLNNCSLGPPLFFLGGNFLLFSWNRFYSLGHPSKRLFPPLSRDTPKTTSSLTDRPAQLRLTEPGPT